MKNMLRDIWTRDPRGFLEILCLNVVVSLTGGISIVMLVPMLSLLEISEGADSALQFLAPFLQTFSYRERAFLLIGCYFLLITLKAALNMLLTIRENYFLEEYSYQLRSQLYHTVSTARWEQLAAGRQTDTINLFTSQCSQVSYAVGELIHLISSMFSAVVSLGIALWLSVPMTIFVVLCGSAFAVVFRRLMKASKEFGDEMIRINRNMYQELFDQLKGMKEVRTYGVQQEHAELFDKVSLSLRDSKLQYVQKRTLPSMLYTVAAAGMIGAIFLVSVLGLKMDTVRLIVLVYVFMRLWPVFSGFFGRLNSIMVAVPAHEKLTEALCNLEAENTMKESAAPLAFEKEIEFRHVTLTYQNGTEPVLKDVSFCLKKGSVTALVGRSGAGKTTIADLLLGFLVPTQGEICIDGVPLTRDNLSAWRYSMGYIPQKPMILNASVRENLLRFHPQATEDEMIEALKKAQAWSVVEKLPKGMDTDLGDEGIRLSGGERQRIVLARVLLGNPRLIVMDEATSAMDYESEIAVRKAFENLAESVTVLVIAHRLATVRTAKYALVLEDGRITEDGKLEELIQTPEGYLNKLLHID